MKHSLIKFLILWLFLLVIFKIQDIYFQGRFSVMFLITLGFFGFIFAIVRKP